MPKGSQEPKKSISDGYLEGRCKWFNVSKGWGFITPTQSEELSCEVFVHQSAISKDGFRSLGEKELVEFKYAQTRRGYEAIEVRAIGGGDVEGARKIKPRKHRCFNCGEFTLHLAANCPHEPLPKKCHHCKSEDHLIQDCPTLPPEKKKEKKTPQQSSEAVEETEQIPPDDES